MHLFIALLMLVLAPYDVYLALRFWEQGRKFNAALAWLAAIMCALACALNLAVWLRDRGAL